MQPSNNKVYDKVKKMFCENSYQMNTLKISYSYEFASREANLNWYDILFAIKNGYLHHHAAVEHATNELEIKDEYPQEVLDLAILSPEEIVFPHLIHPYIDVLAGMVDETEQLKAKDKIMYILLKWVYENKDSYDDPFDVTTHICDDFGFPESITYFAWKFSPMRKDFGSVEKNREHIYDNWKQFIDDQQKIWKLDEIV